MRNTVCRRPCFGADLGFPEDFVREIGCDRHSETLPLVGFYHANNPQDQTQELQQMIESEAEREPCPASRHQAESEQQSKRNSKQMQPAKNDDRLLGMELHERTLIDEEKDQPRHPTKHVAQQTRYIFFHARLCHCVRRCHSTGSALRCATIRTEPRVVRDHSSAFCAMWHLASQKPRPLSRS